MLFGSAGFTRFIQTTSMLRAQVSLSIADSAIRFFSAEEANRLIEQMRKKNIFARILRENSFYVQRAKNLSNRTVIEVFRPGDPRAIADEAQKLAQLIERVAILSTTLVILKSDLLRKIGFPSQAKSETNFIVGPGFYFLRSRSKTIPQAEGILIDERFKKRFLRSGFNELMLFVQTETEVANRVLGTLGWLYDSRTESQIAASTVKTSIALETLLIFTESESLAQSLSERAAFILSQEPVTRKQISRIIKKFYNSRSGIVHGGRKKSKKPNSALLEAIDRLALLLCLIVSANTNLWSSTESLREWCESQRWGHPASNLKIPFPKLFLRNAIGMALKAIDPQDDN